MKKSLKNIAYEFLRERIVNCHYAPGSFINEEFILNEISISRTPLREALNRLEQDGLLSIMPKKGIKICDLTVSDIDIVYEARKLIEPYAILNYGHKVSKSVWKKFCVSLELNVSSENGGFETDDAFHLAIVSAMPNKFLNAAYGQISAQNNRIRIMTGQKVQHRLKQSNAEHLEIITACLNKEWATAKNALEIHLEQAKKAAFDGLQGSFKM